MPLSYIWLGANNEVNDQDGTINTSILEEGKWVVRPLLGWKKAEPDDVYTPAVLIFYGDGAEPANPALVRLLRLMGAEPDPEATMGTWRVFRFESLENSQPAMLDIAEFAEGRTFLPHNKSATVSVTAPAAVQNLAGVITLAEPPVVTLEIAAADIGGPATFSITFKLKSIDRRIVGLNNGSDGDEPLDLTGKSIVVSIETNGDFKVNGTTINDSISPAGSEIRDVVPIIEGTESEQSIGFEVPIGAGHYEHPLPVIGGIEGSKVRLDWNEFRIRLRDDRLGLAAPPPGDEENDELMRVTLSVPLIQAEVGAEFANALAKLIPVAKEGAGDTVLVPLEFTVTLKRPSTTANVEPLLWSVKRTGDMVDAVGELITEALSGLKAVFEEDKTGSNQLIGFVTPLAELGEAVSSGMEFVVGKVDGVIAGSDELMNRFRGLDAFDTTDYPLPLSLRVGRTKGQEVVFLLVIRLNLWSGRMVKNRAYFYAVKSAVNPNNDLLDFTSFAIQLPMREAGGIDKLPSDDDHDGYLDFERVELVLDFLQNMSQSVGGSVGEADRPRTTVFVPGDLEDGNQDRDQRMRLVLRDFDPAAWPSEPGAGDSLQLRLGGSGLSFAAEADTVTPARIPAGDGTFLLRLEEKRDGLRSALVVIDNQIRYANLSGRIEIPGFENLEADLQIGLRREGPSGPPVVVATIDFDRTDRKPLAKLNIPFLNAQLDDLRMQLSWHTDDGPKWDLQAWATGAFSVIGDLQSTGGIKGLDQPTAIPFRDLNLLDLHRGNGQLPLMPTKREDGVPTTADDPARFELLDGQFKIEFYRGILRWNQKNREISFDVSRARFDYQAGSSDLDVAIEAGAVALTFDVGKKSIEFEMPSLLGLEVRIGTQIAFEGEVGWERNERERYFRADGRLTMSGFPEVAGTLKLGTGVKDDGSTAPNLAVFAELPYEADLFSGVVLKRMGLGLGLNNRLAAIGSRPDPRAIIARLNEIDPKKSRNWSFVTESGVYVSVVATAMIASNRGKDNVACTYLAKLLLSIDTNIDIVAAAQIWLFSSPEYLTKGDHERRPTLVGGALLRAREQTFSLVAQTLPRPAIEANEMLSDLLNRVRARFSFYLSSNLADFYLEELSYRDVMFGIAVQAVGSYRIAIGRFGALMRASLGFRGLIPQTKLVAGPGGFTFSGGLQLDAEFGGLVSERGLAAYGAVRSGITFRVSAFILLPTIAMRTISYEETISITISVPYLKCKRWSCKWKRRTISKSITIRGTLVIPVVRIEPYHTPEASLELVLEGALAFDESGGIGFLGTVGISTSIFGHTLRIAPRFDYRPEVIRSVQRRVAAVEDHVNRLRGLPHPHQPQEATLEQPIVETWYYYTSRVDNEMLHLLVPSPEYPSWWYTPRATSLSHYANLPRDTGGVANPEEEGVASPLEKRHLSPFRSAVMRMVMPFIDSAGKLQRVVELAMPWDRANFDALPGENAVSDKELVQLVTRMTEIENAFLNTAATASDVTNETPEWRRQEYDPNWGPLTGVEVVSDPRPESGTRAYWLLSDQMNRPDGVLPYRYRPVEELVSEGFSDVDRRDDIARLLRYEQVRLTAVAQGRYEEVDPSPARQLADARAGLLSTILRDFVRERGPETYGQAAFLEGQGSPLAHLKLVRADTIDGTTQSVVVRRRAVQWVIPDDEGNEKGQLTYAVLENNTDLDLAPDKEGKVNLTVTIPGRNSVEIDLREKLDELYKPIDRTRDIAAQEAERVKARYRPLLDDAIEFGDEPSIVITVSRDNNSTESPGAPLVDRVVFESVKKHFGEAPQEPRIVRQVGLFAVTSPDVQLDLKKVRIVRNEAESLVDANGTANWSRDMLIRIVPMSDPGEDPVEAIQQWIACLPPCQEYLGGAEEEIGTTSPRVRVKLPVKFEDESLKTQLPRLNGFEIYRRFPWQQEPVKIADGVPPILRRVNERGRTIMLVESFLFGEEFPYNPDAGEFEDPARGVIPGVTQIAYSLRAIPFGRVPESASPTLLHWPAITLHVPPPKRELPALGLVIPVESMIEPKDGGAWQIPLHFVDNRPQTWLWPEDGWKTLEIWAEPNRIRSAGFYAVGDASSPVDARTASQESIRHPADLAVERLPESTLGKIKVAVIQRPAAGIAPAGSLRVTDDGRVIDSLPSLRRGQAYRLFVRPEVTAQHPLAQPLSLYLIRQLPRFIDEATPLLHPAEQQLEFLPQSEVERILSPLSIRNRDWAWLSASAFTVSSRTRDNDPRERFRVAWNHESDLDAGVEILTQDCDEPHHVERRLVTVQEEAVFQRAIADFRNPALWQAHPQQPGPGWPTLAELQANSPAARDRTSVLLWRDEHNPVLEQIKGAREGLDALIDTYAAAPTNVNDWRVLHRKLAEYLAAMWAYQRTPLAPAEATDIEGLNAFHAASRAVLVGLKIETVPTKEQLGSYASDVTNQEAKLRRLLNEIAAIDLTAMEVADTPTDYQRAKLQLQDIDVARKLACVVERRLAIADDLLEMNTDDIPLEDADAPDRLPRQGAWNELVRRFISLVPLNEEMSNRFPRTTALLEFFDKSGAETPLFATGQVAAGHLRTIRGLLPDPSELINGTNEWDQDYRRKVAKLVPQAAGLTAAVEALKRDAQSRGWTLVRRPHNQLGTPIDPNRPERLRDFLPDAVSRLNRSDEEGNQASVLPVDGRRLVVPFANLLERLGFGIDVAVVDNLNQPLPQTQLLDWIAAQPWEAITHSLDGQHEIVLMSGREPDTDRELQGSELDEDCWVGYAFVKLIVVPRSLFGDLLGRELAVTVTEVSPAAPTMLKFDRPKSAFDAAGITGETLLRLRDGTEHRMSAIGGDATAATATLTDFTGGLEVGTQVIVTAVTDRSDFQGWLELRSLTFDQTATSSTEDIELSLLQRMATNWWETIAAWSGGQTRPGHLVLETRARRWATVPVLGGRAHIDWEAPDAAGREIQVAVRRVSRYEALLRWARREAVPLVARIDSLGLQQLQSVELRRRMVEGAEEPTTLPVLVSPHPTRAEFIYSLPTSGVRSVVSGLSSRRTGYRGIVAQFVNRRAWIEKVSDGQFRDQHSDLVMALSGRERTHQLTVESVETPTVWIVASRELKKSGHVVVFWSDSGSRDSVRLAKFDFGTIGEDGIGKGNLEILGVAFVQAVSNNDVLDFIVDPLSDPMFQEGSRLVATYQCDPTQTRIVHLKKLDSNTDRIDEDNLSVTFQDDSIVTPQDNPQAAPQDDPKVILQAHNYVGQFAIFLVNGQPKDARIIEAFDPRTQILTLNETLPNDARKGALHVFHGAPLPKRTRINRPEAGGPMLLRNERLISLPALPYYREYGLGVNPQFEFAPVGSSGHQQAEPVFARVRPSVLAAHAAHLHVEEENVSENIYSLRLVLTRQGDQLTPREARAAAELDANDTIQFPSTIEFRSSEPVSVSAYDLPDLLCQYQILWRLPRSGGDNAPAGLANFADPVYIELVDLLMPGHPSLSGQDSVRGKPLLRNRYFNSGPQQVLVQVLGADSENWLGESSTHVPIQVWKPTSAARPIYVVSFRLRVPNPKTSLFGNPDRALLQMQREGFRSYPLPLSVSHKS